MLILLRAHRISSQRPPSSPDLCPVRRGRTDTLDGISTLSGNHEFKDDDEEEGDDHDGEEMDD